MEYLRRLYLFYFFSILLASYTWPASCNMLNTMFNTQTARAMSVEAYGLDQNKSNESTPQLLDDFSSKSQKAYQESLETSVADDNLFGADGFTVFSILPYKSDFTVSKQTHGASSDTSRVVVDTSVQTLDATVEESTSKSLSSDFYGLSGEPEEIFFSESSESTDFSHTGKLDEFRNDMRNQQYNEFETVTNQFHYSQFIVEEVVTKEMKLAHTPSINAEMDASMPRVASRGTSEPFVSLDTSDQMKTTEKKVVDYSVGQSMTASESTQKFSLSSGYWTISGQKIDRNSDREMTNADESLENRNNLKPGKEVEPFRKELFLEIPDSSFQDLAKENQRNKMMDSSSAFSNNLEATAKTSAFDSDINQAGKSTAFTSKGFLSTVLSNNMENEELRRGLITAANDQRSKQHQLNYLLLLIPAAVICIHLVLVTYQYIQMLANARKM